VSCGPVTTNITKVGRICTVVIHRYICFTAFAIWRHC